MERTITVMNTRDQKRTVFTSNAETVGQLKADMVAQGIDFYDLDIIEGITKTTFVADDSHLPSNINYRGQVTNDLIIFLTNTQKKIKSGAPTRAQLYALLSPEMKDHIKELYGKNFTQVSSALLADYLRSTIGETFGMENDIDERHEGYQNEIEEEILTKKKCLHTQEQLFEPFNIISAIIKIANVLLDNDIMTQHDYTELEDILDIQKPEIKKGYEEVGGKSPYSNDDIQNIMDDLGL